MSMATDDSITSSTSFPTPHGTVDGNSPTLRSKKASHIKIGGHVNYDYSTDAVMNGSRGHEKREHARFLNGRSQLAPSETAKKGRFGRTDSNSHGIASTPAFGAVVRG